MRGVVLPGLLEALLLRLTGLLFALRLEVVGRGVFHAAAGQQPERSKQEPTQGATARASCGERTGQSIEARVVHGAMPSMMRTMRLEPF
jgi:hypothetical protein